LKKWRAVELLIEKEGQMLLGSKFTEEEDCCLICGESDYEDSN
jgi:hypothetical protein